jgi:hypothetical protein
LENLELANAEYRMRASGFTPPEANSSPAAAAKGVTVHGGITVQVNGAQDPGATGDDVVAKLVHLFDGLGMQVGGGPVLAGR